MKLFAVLLAAAAAFLCSASAFAQTAEQTVDQPVVVSSPFAATAADDQAPVATPVATKDPGTPSPASATDAKAVVPAVEDKRAYGVLPNYRTAEAGVPYSPITPHQTLMIGFKDSFDGAAYPLAAFFTGISQLANSNPSFGQGFKGFAHRYGTSFADQVIGNMLTESFLPLAFHEDPRFFRKGTGTKLGRLAYAASRVLVCRADNGHNTFNAAEVVGNGIVGAVGNAYYPDARGFKDTMSRMWTQIGTDTISNALKEFWPDVKHYYIRKHREKLARQQKAAPAPGF